HSGLTNNSNYDEIGAKDLVFAFPSVTQFGWTKYYVDVTVPSDPKVKSLSVRIHPYSRFTGTIYFDDLEIEVINTVTDVKNNQVIPMTYSLYQNYPNPFNPSTVISYTLPEIARITLKIYDVLGREVKTLINGEQPAGVYKLSWNGNNNLGSKVASGIYIYRIEAGSGKFIQTKKMILLK
ncbi:MAG: T9SS type A sorting domain-containing protein, partial [Ignavibacteriales bacterium]|nr:T9SS type A sorting domain-containing protein [Ignavibacteriales bacterium]